MRGAHAAVSTLRKAVAGRASPAEARVAVRSMLRGDPEFPVERDAVDLDEGYGAAIDEAARGVALLLDDRARERERAAALARKVEEVFRVSPNEARRLAGTSPPNLVPAFLRALSGISDAAALEAPKVAVGLAEIAVELATRYEGDPPSAEWAESLATALRALGEAHFRAGDLVEAERALVQARAAFAQGTFSPALDGELLRLEAEVRSDQSRFTEARRLAQRAVRRFRRAGERAAEARATISLALKWFYEGELERALETTDRALGLLDLERDGRLRFAAEFNRVFWLNDSGMHEEARAALPRIAELVERHGGRSDRIRLAWLEARIVAREGDLERAVELYRDVLAQCLELEVLYDSATVAFELAILLLELGRAAEVLPLAETVARVFATQGAAPEAGAAVLLAADALRRGAAAQEALRLLRERERRGRPSAR